MIKVIDKIKFKRAEKKNLPNPFNLDAGEPLLVKNDANSFYLYTGGIDGAATVDNGAPMFKAQPSDRIDNGVYYKHTDGKNCVKLYKDDYVSEIYPSVKNTEIPDTNKYYVTSFSGDIEDGLFHTNAVYIKENVIYGAAWNPDPQSNDYAESRLVQTDAEAGECVVEVGSGTMIKSFDYLQPTGSIISDTYGHRIGSKTDEYKPVAVSGRVLVYVDESKGMLEIGDAVMTAPNGKVAKMTRRQIKKYPDRIVGIVSELPSYEKWGKVEVKGRVWIRVR